MIKYQIIEVNEATGKEITLISYKIDRPDLEAKTYRALTDKLRKICWQLKGRWGSDTSFSKGERLFFIRIIYHIQSKINYGTK